MVSKRVSILSPFAVLLVTGSLFAESVNLLPGALTRSVQPLDPVSTVILDGIDLQAALAEDGRRDRMGGHIGLRSGET